MPLYEYRCEDDGGLVTLLRPMAQADEPVEDPQGLGRHFNRVHSVFQVDATTATPEAPAAAGSPLGGCCCGSGGCGH